MMKSIVAGLLISSAEALRTESASQLIQAAMSKVDA
jgi:hypothetical protein